MAELCDPGNLASTLCYLQLALAVFYTSCTSNTNTDLFKYKISFLMFPSNVLCTPAGKFRLIPCIHKLIIWEININHLNIEKSPHLSLLN